MAPELWTAHCRCLHHCSNFVTRREQKVRSLRCDHFTSRDFTDRPDRWYVRRGTEARSTHQCPVDIHDATYEPDFPSSTPSVTTDSMSRSALKIFGRRRLQNAHQVQPRRTVPFSHETADRRRSYRVRHTVNAENCRCVQSRIRSPDSHHATSNRLTHAIFRCPARQYRDGTSDRPNMAQNSRLSESGSSAAYFTRATPTERGVQEASPSRDFRQEASPTCSPRRAVSNGAKYLLWTQLDGDRLPFIRKYVHVSPIMAHPILHHPLISVIDSCVLRSLRRV